MLVPTKAALTLPLRTYLVYGMTFPMCYGEFSAPNGPKNYLPPKKELTRKLSKRGLRLPQPVQSCRFAKHV
jgi:hypothetical protein